MTTRAPSSMRPTEQRHQIYLCTLPIIAKQKSVFMPVNLILMASGEKILFLMRKQDKLRILGEASLFLHIQKMKNLEHSGLMQTVLSFSDKKSNTWRRRFYSSLWTLQKRRRERMVTRVYRRKRYFSGLSVEVLDYKCLGSKIKRFHLIISR